MSAMVQNKHLPLSTDGKMLTMSDRDVGVVFRQELVEKYYGKCAFVYDGASNNRYNFGCGNLATADHIKCNNTYSPWANICPSTDKPCTGSDTEVTSGSCDQAGGHASET